MTLRMKFAVGLVFSLVLVVSSLSSGQDLFLSSKNVERLVSFLEKELLLNSGSAVSNCVSGHEEILFVLQQGEKEQCYLWRAEKDLQYLTRDQ